MTTRILRLACLLLIGNFFVVAPALSGVEIREIGLGWDGQWKLGCWTPVRVTLQSDISVAGTLVVSALDGEGVTCRYTYQALLQLSPGETVVYRSIKVGRIHGSIRVAFYPDESGIAQGVQPITTEHRPDVTKVIGANQQWIMVWGDDIGLADMLRLNPRPPSEAMRATSVAAVESLPRQWYDYEGVDVVILPTGDAEFLSQVNPAQFAALISWVEQGGRVVVAVGQAATSVLALDHPVSRLIPGTLDAVFLQRETNELRSYAKSNQRIDLVWSDLPRAERGLMTVRLQRTSGRVLAAEGAGRRRTDWIIQSSLGLGLATFVAADLEVGPLAAWKGRPRLLSRLVGDLLDAELDTPADETQGQTVQAGHLGFVDLSGQLRAALDQFTGVTLVPFILIAGLATGYVLWIGPIDWFLLRRFATRMEWTWLTFPLAIAAMAAASIGLASAWKGSTAKQNTAEIIDIDARQGHVRGTIWSHCYAPEAGYYGFALAPHWNVNSKGDRLISWQGLPGTGFGGMQTRSVAPALPDEYELEATFGATSETTSNYDEVCLRMKRVPMPTWSSRGLTGVWTAEIEPDRESSLTEVRRGLLEGEVRNPLDVNLRDCILCFGRMFYEVGSLRPNQPFFVNDRSRPLSLQYRLTRRQITADNQELISPWEKESLDVTRVMEMIMFHGIAGGRGYTDLLHRFQGHLDMSQQLRSGSAVLVGRLEGPATNCKWRDAESGETVVPDTKHWSYCRVIFPVVERTTTAESNL